MTETENKPYDYLKVKRELIKKGQLGSNVLSELNVKETDNSESNAYDYLKAKKALDIR